MLFTIKRGYQYANIWPLIAKLGMIFPENRVIIATKFAQKAAPFMILLTLLWQYIMLDYQQVALSATVITCLATILLPIQGFYWLGKRADTALPEQTAVWYFQMREKLSHLRALPMLSTAPTYWQLAELLQYVTKHFDASFWDEL